MDSDFDDFELRALTRTIIIGVIGTGARAFCDLHSGSNTRLRTTAPSAAATKTFIQEYRQVCLMEIHPLDDWVASRFSIIQGVTRFFVNFCRDRSKLDAVIFLDDLNPAKLDETYLENEYSHIVRELCRDDSSDIVVHARNAFYKTIYVAPTVVTYTGSIECGNQMLRTLLKAIPLRVYELQVIGFMARNRRKDEREADAKRKEEKRRETMNLGRTDTEDSKEENRHSVEELVKCHHADEERSGFGNELDDTKDALFKLTEGVEELYYEVDALKGESEDHADHIENFGNVLHDVKVRVYSLESRTKARTEDVDLFSNEMNEIRQQLRKAIDTNHFLLDKVSASQAEVRQHQNEIDALKQENQQLRHLLAAKDQEYVDEVDVLKCTWKKQQEKWSREIASINQRMSSMSVLIEKQARQGREQEDEDGWLVT